MAEEEVSDTDLGGGRLSRHNLALLQVERDEARQRIRHQNSAFWVGVIFIAVMTGFFLWFAKRIVCIFEQNSGSIDWHVLMLGSGLIVPPTVIIFALIHRAYSTNGNKKEDDELPCIGPLKEIVSMAKEVTEMVGDVAKKIR